MPLPLYFYCGGCANASKYVESFQDFIWKHRQNKELNDDKDF